MKRAELPSRNPTTRVYTPGVIPQTRFEAQNGATSFVRFGSTPVNTRLQLTYQNTSEKTAYQFTKFYNRCITENLAVHIPWNSKTVEDMEDADGLRLIVRGGDDGLQWLFEKPITIEANLGGRYNVTIDLIGTLIA